MKNSLKATFVLLVTSLVFIGIACQPDQQSEEQTNADKQQVDAVPFNYHMSFMHDYSAKLYLAGMEENWGLADIYAHEIEEITETIIDGDHTDDGIDLSGLLDSMLPPQIEQIEAAIDAQDRNMFENNYQTLIQTCNQCHQAANYGLVQITVPESNPFNQDFSAPEEQ